MKTKTEEEALRIIERILAILDNPDGRERELAALRDKLKALAEHPGELYSHAAESGSRL